MKHASRSPLPSQLFLTANEKDFSLSLEMTMRGKGFAIGKAAFSLLPLEGGAPKGRRLALLAIARGLAPRYQSLLLLDALIPIYYLQGGTHI